MLTWDFFKHYLFSRRAGALVRMVAWICIVGVGVGVMALIVILSVMNGFNESHKHRLLAVEPHLVVQIPSVNTFDQVNTHALYSGLQARSGVQARVFETQEVMLRTEDGLFGGGIARAVDAPSLRAILKEVKNAMNREKRDSKSADVDPVLTPMDPDGPSSPSEVTLGPGEILIGVDLAKSLGLFSGQRVTMIAPEALLLPAGEKPDFERVTIKGLLVTNIADIDSKMILYDRKTTLRHLKDSASKEVGIEVRLPDPDNYDALKRELEREGAKVTTWIDRNSSIFFALKMEKIAIGTVLGLSALIASFSIVTVLILLMTQKRKDIGVLMAMGLSARKTRNVFIGLGLILSGIGIGGGLVLGLLVCWVISTFPLDILPAIYYQTTIPATVDPRLVFIILLVAAVISSLSVFFPARTHTSLLPAEALRSRASVEDD